jgi:VIT1/CCC1 family predicted Fe2+/Mn2+ transporter
MTFIGGILHAIPFLLPNIWHAVYLAYFVVGLELIVISYIRNRYFKMSFLLSAFQVIVGGLLVIAAGILIGNA